MHLTSQLSHARALHALQKSTIQTGMKRRKNLRGIFALEPRHAPLSSTLNSGDARRMEPSHVTERYFSACYKGAHSSGMFVPSKKHFHGTLKLWQSRYLRNNQAFSLAGIVIGGLDCTDIKNVNTLALAIANPIVSQFMKSSLISANNSPLKSQSEKMAPTKRNQ